MKTNQFYKYLQCRGVFACHCTVTGRLLNIGILVLDPESNLENGSVRLVAPDEDPQPTFIVLLTEDLQAVNYSIQLEILL